MRINVPADLPNPNIVNVCLSPDATRVAFVVGYGDGPPATNGADYAAERHTRTALSPYRPRSVFTRDEPTAQLRAYCIVVCHIDGSAMHEVGTWLESEYPDFVLDVENLDWLPGGKRLSFLCDDVFYTVPAD
jgi:hypothetical protein